MPQQQLLFFKSLLGQNVGFDVAYPCHDFAILYRSNLNFVYDHGMDTYIGRLEDGKEFVEAKDLNQLYIDENLLSQPEMV